MAKNNKRAGARRRLALLALLCALVPASARAQAPAWPTKPLRIVVPYAPGAINDVLAAEGIEPVGTTPAQFSAFIRSEIPLWAGIIRQGNIRTD